MKNSLIVTCQYVKFRRCILFKCIADMKNPYFFIFIAFISGMLGIWVGVIFIPLFWEGLAFKDNIFSGIGTWIGSIGTIGTLLYLIYQNNQLRDNQKQTNEKQQEMWDSQREIIAFQKLQTHKKEFNAILDDLESNFPIIFVNRANFYRNIFPNNDFEKCSPKVPLAIKEDQVVAGDLSDIRDATKFINDSLNEFSLLSPKKIYNHTHRHLHQISSIMSTLHMNIIRPKETGDVFIDIGDGYFLLNAINPSLTLEIIERVVNTLMQFTGNKDNFQISLSYMCTSFYLKALQQFAFYETHHRGYFIFKKSKLGHYIDDLFSCLLIISRPELNEEPCLSEIRYRLNFLFCDKTELLLVLDSKEKLYKLFTEILYGVAEYCDKNKSSQEFDILRDELRTKCYVLKTID